MTPLTPERWSRLWVAIANAEPPAEYFRRLQTCYSETHRRYHNLQHIEECLKEFDHSRDLARDPLAVELAIWFHDIVYDPHSTDNEERSTQLAHSWLSDSNANPELLHAVSRLILATKKHDSSLDEDDALIVDIDLGILGQTEDRFLEYETQIRQEYDWVPQPVFCAKRAEILEGFLERKRIFNKDTFFLRYESPARRNLETSLNLLRSSSIKAR